MEAATETDLMLVSGSWTPFLIVNCKAVCMLFSAFFSISSCDPTELPYCDMSYLLSKPPAVPVVIICGAMLVFTVP